jgi:hypothetical protein
MLNVHHPALVAGFLVSSTEYEIDDLPAPESIPAIPEEQETKPKPAIVKPAPAVQSKAIPIPVRKPERIVAKPRSQRHLPAAIRAPVQSTEVLKSAQRLAGLRMAQSQDFIRHVLRVNDVQVKASDRSEIAERLLKKLRRGKRFKTRGTPAPGDFVFFEQTRGGYGPGVPSLVGIVDHVDRHGTVHFFAQVGEVVDRSVVTPRRPKRRRDARSARVLNSYVRTKRSGDPQDTEYLAGQLLLGYGKL